MYRDAQKIRSYSKSLKVEHSSQIIQSSLTSSGFFSTDKDKEKLWCPEAHIVILTRLDIRSIRKPHQALLGGNTVANLGISAKQVDAACPPVRLQLRMYFIRYDIQYITKTKGINNSCQINFYVSTEQGIHVTLYLWSIYLRVQVPWGWLDWERRCRGAAAAG